MWFGGVRVVVFDDKNRILMVKQNHPERTLWMLPGGSIEEKENSRQAAIREVKEETGIDIAIGGLIWHVEEVSNRGSRFVNIFIAKAIELEPKLGRDPEYDEDEQVLADVKFMTREEILELDNIYPLYVRDELWEMMENGELEYDAFRLRERF